MSFLRVLVADGWSVKSHCGFYKTPDWCRDNAAAVEALRASARCFARTDAVLSARDVCEAILECHGACVVSELTRKPIEGFQKATDRVTNGKVGTQKTPLLT